MVAESMPCCMHSVQAYSADSTRISHAMCACKYNVLCTFMIYDISTPVSSKWAQPRTTLSPDGDI